MPHGVSRSGRPNILLVITHDTGRHLGCYGRGVRTPNIDGLARKGARFDSFFCSAPQCSPSRGSIMTGRYPHVNGLMGLTHLGFELRPGERTLPQFLNDAGYSTHLFGFQHEASDPARLGYRHIIQSGDHLAQTVAPRAAEFLRERENDREAAPFFAMVGFTETHRPFDRQWYRPDDPDRPVRGIRTVRYKFIRHFSDAKGIYIPVDIHKGLSGRAVRDEYYSRPYVEEELYDLAEDPLEQRNLASLPDYSDVVTELRNRVASWMVQTRDPLLEGPIPGRESSGWDSEKRLGTYPGPYPHQRQAGK